MAQVFISYSSKDELQASEFIDKLEQAGILCWVAPRDIPLGSDYTKEIPKAIKNSIAFLLLLSGNSQKSPWVKSEINYALTNKRVIFPLLIEDTALSDDFQFILSNFQIRPYFREADSVFSEIITQIQEMEQQLPEDNEQNPPVIQLRITRTGEIKTFNARTIIWGRAPSCEIKTDILDCSRYHVMIHRIDDDSFLVQSLNPTNGTYISSKTLQGHRMGSDFCIVSKGCIIRAGKEYIELL